MILTCPECATSYFVDDAKIAPEGRTVKCASCGAQWTARREAPLELSSSPEEGAVASEPEAKSDPVGELTGEDLPKVFRAKAATEKKVFEAMAVGVVWAGLGAVLLTVIVLGVIFRADVVRMWPKTASVFAAVKQDVNAVGLTIESVDLKRTLHEGHAAFSITGVIRNIEDHPVTAPPLKFSLVDKSDKTLAAKVAKPADPLIPPGKTRHFAIFMTDPPKGAEWLEVSFEPQAKTSHKADKAHPKAKSSVSLRGAAEPTAPAPAAAEAVPLPDDSPHAAPHPAEEPHG
jgi:predicted Zn finger-like uncharacterized protein